MGQLIGITGVLGFIAALVFIRFNHVTKKSKIIPIIASVVCFALFVIGVAMPSSDSDSQSVDAKKVKEEKQSEESEEKTEKEEPKKEKITFNLKSAKCNTENEGVDVVIETPDLPDGTNVHVRLTNQYLVDNTDLGYTVHLNSTKVKDGKLKLNLGATKEDFKYPDFIRNGSYEIKIYMYVTNSENTHLQDKWGNLEDFKDKYSVDGEVEKTEILTDGEVKEKDKGYKIDNVKLGEIEVTEGYTTAEIKQKKMEYKKENAKTIDFKKLSKNADRYSGEYVTYTGEIIQIMEDNALTHIRLALDDWNEEVIFVEYQGYTDFVKGDKVTIYGKVHGSYSYTSQAGWKITLPGIIADEIE